MNRSFNLSILCGFLLYALTGVAEEAIETPLEVVSVTPSGDGVSTTFGRITVEFNKPMVALGRSLEGFSGEIPVEVTPGVRCAWRAFETNEYTCFLDDDLEAETTYAIKVLQTAKSLDGSVLGTSREYTFKTALLHVEAETSHWRSLTQPITGLWFSRPVSLDTVLKTVRI
ncbi:MAG: hypothetical protein F4Z66_10970, partial [Gammaproteobacteria bacterium]|nr:hypothetical protein [Gammaproteobacteria bacterium]